MCVLEKSWFSKATMSFGVPCLWSAWYSIHFSLHFVAFYLLSNLVLPGHLELSQSLQWAGGALESLKVCIKSGEMSALPFTSLKTWTWSAWCHHSYTDPKLLQACWVLLVYFPPSSKLHAKEAKLHGHGDTLPCFALEQACGQQWSKSALLVESLRINQCYLTAPTDQQM